jgi:hypothetical protein
MAYLVILASMPTEKVAEIAAPQDIGKFASRVALCSHLVTEFCPAIAGALDGGVPLVTKMWHPVRGPAVYAPEVVPLALARLEAVVRDRSSLPVDYAEWTVTELSRAVELYRHASERGEAVVSMLDLTRSESRR